MKAVFRKECRHQLLSFKSIFFVLLFIVLGVSLEQLFSAVSIDIGGIDNKTYAGSFYVDVYKRQPKDFDRVARRWHVDYAFYKTGPDKYLLTLISSLTAAGGQGLTRLVRCTR